MNGPLSGQYCGVLEPGPVSLHLESLSLRDSVAGLGFLMHEGSLPLISHCAC